MKTYCEYTDKILNIKDEHNTVAVARSLRTHLVRSDIDVISLVEQLGYVINRCGFCGRMVPFRLVPIIVYNDKTSQYDIKIESLVYGYSVAVKAPFYCGHSLCIGKSLNHNSVDFVSKAYKLSADQALTFIHNRNRTPFYQNNHPDDEQYKSSQSSYSKEQTREQTLHGAYKRSKDFLIEKYGERIGNITFNETCEKKKITFNNLKRIYSTESEEQINQRLLKWKISCNNNKINFMKRYGPIQGNIKWLEFKNKQRSVNLCGPGDLENWLVTLFRSISPNLMRSKPIKSFLNKQYWLDAACLEFFNKSVDDVLIDILTKYPEFDMFEGQMFKTRYNTYNMYTIDGTLLKSSYEIHVYTMLIDAGLIEGADFSVNGWYPNKQHRYDFFFPYINLYVEIAGMMQYCDYKENVELKKKLYNTVIIIEPHEIEASIGEIIHELSNC